MQKISALEYSQIIKSLVLKQHSSIRNYSGAHRAESVWSERGEGGGGGGDGWSGEESQQDEAGKNNTEHTHLHTRTRPPRYSPTHSLTHSPAYQPGEEIRAFRNYIASHIDETICVSLRGRFLPHKMRTTDFSNM